jgi:HD-GYP domain-containing protein (c-di-GMP phosphodiesterase class II)
VPVAVSIGLVVYPTEAQRIEELITRADNEMYAAKRHRPVGSAGRGRPGRLDLGRAAKMVEEIVPLMMSGGDLNAKLRLVARRLSVSAGYEIVHFTMFGASYGKPEAQTTFAPTLEEIVEAWNRDERAGKLYSALKQTQRAIIVDDPQRDERLTAEERELVRAAGVRSALMTPMICHDEVIGSLSVASKREAAFGSRDVEFVTAIATLVTAIVCMATLIDELQSTSNRLAEARSETVMLLAAAAEAHDRTTGQHLQSVLALTEALARELGYSEEDATELGLAAVLHDIGKIRVPDIILASTGRLGGSEWELLARHSGWGEELLAGTPGFELAATIARSHHERWNGGGYPDRLAGEAIPEAATIVAVADSFDAMISDRPYRSARSVAAAVREIVRGSGQQFSPKVVEALLRLHKRRVLPRPRRAARREEMAA